MALVAARLEPDREETFTYDIYSWTEHMSRKTGQWLASPDDLLAQFAACGGTLNPLQSIRRYTMKILVICDDYWHPAATVRGGLAPLDGGPGDPGLAFDWIENAHDWSPDRMAEYPVVLFAKSNNVSQEDQSHWMTPEVEQAFHDYVHGGKGMLVVHSGTAGYRETPVLRALMGGTFDHHPEACPVTMIPRAGHPLAEGAETYTAQDEHYFMIFDDPEADVYLTTRSENGEQPGAWALSRDAGRVCVLTPGHNVEVWLHPSFQALLRNALAWCAGIQKKP